MIDDSLPARDVAFLERVDRYLMRTHNTSLPAHLTVRNVESGACISINFGIPITMDKVFFDLNTPSDKPGLVVMDQDEFIDSLPPLLEELYTRRALELIFDKLRELSEGPIKFIQLTAGGWFASSVRLSCLFVEEPTCQE